MRKSDPPPRDIGASATIHETIVNLPPACNIPIRTQSRLEPTASNWLLFDFSSS